MHFYSSAPIWNKDDPKIPHTCNLAKPTGWEKVSNAKVMHLLGATYRGAVFDGNFVLDERHPIRPNKQGWNEGIFFCCWFGLRLKTRGIKIAFNPATAKDVTDPSCVVVKNLSL